MNIVTQKLYEIVMRTQTSPLNESAVAHPPSCAIKRFDLQTSARQFSAPQKYFREYCFIVVEGSRNCCQQNRWEYERTLEIPQTAED